MSDDDISDWERELENNTPIIADSTILAEIFHKQNEQKQEESLTKEQKNKTALVVPSEDVFMEKWNSLEEKQKALLFKILSTEPIFSSEKDENQARLQQLQEENEKIANMTTEERRA